MRLTHILIFSCIVILSGCGSPAERAAGYIQSAQELFDQGDYVAAKLEAQNAVQISPKNAEARYLLALIAEQQGFGREMLGHLQVAVAEAPQMVAARVKLGTLYVLGRVYELAAEQAEAAEALAPDDPDVVVLKARLALQQGDSEQGLAILGRALDLDPDHVVAIGMQASAWQENEPDRALDLLDQAIRRLPTDEILPLHELKLDILSRHERTEDMEQALLVMIEGAVEDESIFHSRLVRFYKEQGQLDKAEAMLRDIAAAPSGSIGARLNVVQFLAEAKTRESATEALRTFIDDDPENQQLLIALGDGYLIDNRHDKAVIAFTEVVTLDPLSELGLLARVKLTAEKVRTGDTDGAMQQVDNILTDAPAFSDALLLRAGLLFSERRYDDAIADLRILLRKEKGNQRALLLMGRSEAAADNMILSEDAYRRLLGLNPNHRTAIRELVSLMVQAERFDAAEKLLEGISQGSSANLEAAILMVELQMLQDDWPAAVDEARRIASGTDPGGIGPFMLGQVFEGQQRYEEAVNAFKQALEKSPDNISILQGLARSLNAQGKEEETIALLRGKVKAYPENPAMQLMLGGALKDTGQNPEALRVFESVISDHPELSPSYVALASLYPDDVTKRVDSFRRGLTAVPGNLPLGKLLANEYQRQGRFAALVELYEELLVSHPETWEIANNLAALLADLYFKNPEHLVRAVQLADSLASNDEPAVIDTVGWVYYRAGDGERAVRYLERAVTLLTDMPVVNYHLGMAYLVVGNEFGAKQELAKAIQMAATDFAGIEDAREALAGLQ